MYIQEMISQSKTEEEVYDLHMIFVTEYSKGLISEVFKAPAKEVFIS